MVETALKPLSEMSDEEFIKLRAAKAAETTTLKPLSEMSDEEFLKIRNAKGERSTYQPTAAQDMLNVAPGALGRGALAIPGMGGDISELALRGYDWIRGAPSATAEEMDQRTILPTSRELEQAYETATGVPFYEAKTKPGKVFESALEAVPAAGSLSGGLAKAGLKAGAKGVATQAGKNAFKYGVAPMGTSELFKQGAEGTGFETEAGIAGMLTGLLGPTLATRLVTPFSSSPLRQKAVATLEKEGVKTLTAGQKTGNKKLQYIESELGGQKVDDILETQGEEFTTAALQRGGIAGKRATPETLKAAYKEMGDQFDSLAARNDAIVDQSFTDELISAAGDFANTGPAPEKMTALKNYFNRIGFVMTPEGTIPGVAYKALRSDIEKAARGSSDPEYSIALREVKNALDDVMERSMEATGSEDLGAWQQVRKQYRDFLVIEKAAAAGSATEGLLTPQQLRIAEVASRGRRDYVLGRGNFGDLARAGETVMKPLPNSGTASRLGAKGISTALGAIVGGAASGGDIPTSLLGAMGGTAIPSFLGKAILSKTGRKYLGNQATVPPKVSPRGAATATVTALQQNFDPPNNILRDKDGNPILDDRERYIPLR